MSRELAKVIGFTYRNSPCVSKIDSGKNTRCKSVNFLPSEKFHKLFLRIRHRVVKTRARLCGAVDKIWFVQFLIFLRSDFSEVDK